MEFNVKNFKIQRCMAKISRFEDLEIWKQSAAIGVKIYSLSEQGKLKNDFGAKDQIRRSASSISNNIAEGFEYNNKEFIRFLKFAKGSAGELRSQLYILMLAEFIPQKSYEELYKELISISSQLGGFIKYLKASIKKI
jgi:four helix bundle protein